MAQHGPFRAPEAFAALLDLGFEAAAPGPLRLDLRRVGMRDWKLVDERAAMGTRVSVAAIHPSPHVLEEAAGRSFEEMDRAIALLNRYDARSAVGVLNREGRLDGAPPELTHVLDRASVVHRLTDGAFDVTVQPLVDLLRNSPRIAAGEMHDEAEWQETLALVGADGLRVAGDRVSLAREGMGITLDGIAKGFIVDLMAATLEAHGVRRFLIDAGGDIRASGQREDGEPWCVAVRDPLGDGVLPDPARLTGGAVATSGSYEARFDPQGEWHHIVSSRSGRSPRDVLSVTVLGPNALAVDALATAACLEGPEGAVRLIDSLPGFECLVVAPGGRTHRSSGWSRPTTSPHRNGNT